MIGSRVKVAEGREKFFVPMAWGLVNDDHEKVFVALTRAVEHDGQWIAKGEAVYPFALFPAMFSLYGIPIAAGILSQKKTAARRTAAV